MNLEILVSFVGASMLLTVMPGPDILYVLVQSISNGVKYGIVTALGLVSGILIHTSFVAFGVSAIINESEVLLFAIKLFGAFYLVFLAFKTYTSNEKLQVQLAVEKKELIQLYWQGFLMNVLNPKVTIFFLAFLPGFLYSQTQNKVVQFYVLGGLFIVQALVIFCLVALLSSKLNRYLKSHQNFDATIKWIKIGVLVSIAIFILIF